MDLQNKIKSLFAEGIGSHDEKNINAIIGKKKALKNLGRKSIKKSKIKSKRKNNFKTQDARRILASKHGVSNALKKNKNKFIMDYADIAKLMRQYNYTFQKDNGKWFRKKDKSAPEAKSNEPEKSEAPKEAPPEVPKKTKIKVEKPEDIDDKLKSDKKPSLKITNPSTNKEENNYLSDESMKSYQARLIAYLLHDKWLDAIQIVDEQKLEFYLPKETIYDFLTSKELTWIEDRQVWIDIDGDYPIPDDIHNGRKGITARAILANAGFVNFLDLDTSDDTVLSSITELKYKWIDNMWIKPEVTTELARRTFPEIVTNNIVGRI